MDIIIIIKLMEKQLIQSVTPRATRGWSIFWREDNVQYLKEIKIKITPCIKITYFLN